MGIIAGGKATRASGGTVTTAGQYTVHAFTTVGANTFTPATTGFVDILLIGGGGASGEGYGDGGGGAGATLFKKMIPVIASTPYPIVVASPGAVNGGIGPGGTGGNTTFTYSGITTTAFGGAGGVGSPPAPFTQNGYPASNASGSGAGQRNNPTSSAGGTGANIYGIGYPGGQGNGGGGGAGGIGTYQSGGPGVPVAYFTGNPSHIASAGGNGASQPLPSPATPNHVTYASFDYGHGGTAGSPNKSGSQGVAYIRYI